MEGSMTSGKGVYSYNKNPLSAPRKGSELPMKNMGNNSDRAKAIKLMDAQEKNENLRGKMG